MEDIHKLIVSICIDENPIEVGTLIADKNKIYFKFSENFIQQGIEISPFKMKLSSQILEVNTPIFEGLFGIFSDSLPDGWGRLLLDRALIAKGISPTAITPLQRLACVGNNAMGALQHAPGITIDHNTNKLPTLDVLEKEMNKVLEGTPTAVIEELYNLGGTSGGARPKIFIGYNPITNTLMHGINNLPKNYEHWIIKFPASVDVKDIANIEYAYYNMALDAGIEMNKSKLFTTNSGAQYFGTKRFDRINNNKLHMHSASGLLHDNFRYSNLDYGHIMDAAFKLERHINAYTKVLRLAAFNVFAHNRDDHSKNISFLMDAGNGKNPGRKELLELATTFGIKNANTIIDQVKSVIANWKYYAQDCGVSKQSTQLISNTLNNRND